MKRAVKKSKQPDHSPKCDEAMQACDSSERSDCESCDNETDGPDSGLIGDVGDRICAEVSVQSIPCKDDEGSETREKDARLNERFLDFAALHSSGVVMYIRYSICNPEPCLPYFLNFFPEIHT